MAILTQIEIKGYRSIKDASVDFGPLNVLIGANGAGKSNFISFFKMLNEMMGLRLQEYLARTGRAKSALFFGSKVTHQLEANLMFEHENALNTYSMRLIHAAGDNLIFADESLNSSEIDSSLNPPFRFSFGAGFPESTLADFPKWEDLAVTTSFRQLLSQFRHLLSRCRVYHFHDTSPTSGLRQFCYINDNRSLMPDGSNLAALLYAYRMQHATVYRRIVSTIRKIMPEFDAFDLEPDRLNSKEIILNWRKRGSDYLFGPHQISDGTIRAMAILTLFLQPEADLPDVIILDEPELGLHPHALEIVAGLMRAVSETKQVIVATQSQTFLEHFEPSEIIVVESHQNSSHFRRLEAEPLQDWLNDYSIGELWEKNVLGGGPIP